MDIKENLATNLIKYRKAHGLTQLELAEKLNYSDKAVSKWERGESFPDLAVMKQIADLYNTTIDTLISKPTLDKPKISKNIFKVRLIISLCSVILVWLIAIACFTLSHLVFDNINHSWLVFIYAVFLSTLISFIYAYAWKAKLINTIILSLLLWSFITALFLTLLLALSSPPTMLWMVYLVGVPIQVLIILAFYYKKVK